MNSVSSYNLSLKNQRFLDKGIRKSEFVAKTQDKKWPKLDRKTKMFK